MLSEKYLSKTGELSKLEIPEIVCPIPIRIHWMDVITRTNVVGTVIPHMHQHSFFEAHFLLSGGMEWEAETGKYPKLCKREGVLYPPQTRHKTVCMDGDTVRFTLAFSPKQGSILEQHLLQHGIHCFELSSRLLLSIKRLFYEMDQTDLMSLTLMQNCVLDMISEIARTIPDCGEYTDCKKNSGSNPLTTKIKQYIADNPDRLLSCREVAEYCHFNAKYLSRIFLQQNGISLLDYIHREKIAAAEVLLHDRSLSVKDVSSRLGFSSENYFICFFKRVSGRSPGQYRRMMK